MHDGAWFEALFKSIDAKDTKTFLTFLTADGLFRYGSNPPAVGHAAIGATVDQFFATIQSSQHRVLRIWQETDSAVCQGEVRYTLPDDRQIELPFCNVFALSDARIARYEIYIDPTPLIAAQQMRGSGSSSNSSR